MPVKPFYAIVLLAIVLFSFVTPLRAATLTVTSTADDGSVGTLRWAVTVSQDGDTINFNLAYPATIALGDFDMVINHSFTITGPGSGKLTIDSSNNHGDRIFTLKAGTVSISGLTLTGGGGKGSDSSLNGEGGAIYSAGTLSLSDVTVTNNHVSAQGVGGGGIFSSGTLSLSGCTVEGNQAGGLTMGVDQSNQPIVVRGGGIRNQSGSLTVSNSTIANNFAHEGGGIWTNGTQFSVSGSTFSGNQAGVGVSTNLNLEGGGIYIRSSVGGATVANSTFVNNQGKIYGGAITINSGGSQPDVTVSDSTFSANTAHTAGGAFSVETNNLILANDLLSDPSECYINNATVTSVGHNLASDSSCGLTSAGDQQNAAAGLDPSGLQNNGGPTQTVALLSTSQAVDTGSCTDASSNSVTTDQRGIARPQGSACDIGAFELEQSSTNVVTNTNDSGSGSLRDAIANAQAGSAVDFNLTYPASIVLTSGVLNIDKDLTIRGPGAASLSISGNNGVTCFIQNGNKFCTPPTGGSQIFFIASGTTVSITGMTLENGNNDNGGALVNYGTLKLADCVVTGNLSAQGAGINNQATGNLAVKNCTISDNGASVFGGGLANFGTASVTASTLSGNVSGEAAGAFNAGTLTIVNSTLAGNKGTVGEAAIGNDSILSVSSSTFYNNSAASNSFPSGIYNFSSGTTTVKGTLFATGALGTNCNSIGGTFTSQGHNLADDTSCISYLGDPTDQNNVAAGLDPDGLKDNGGPTQTVALLSTSAALDAIPGIPTDLDANNLTTDQRGVTRPQGASSDIGAFELEQVATTTALVSSLNPSIFGQSITFTATVQAGSGTPAGTVSFLDGPDALGTGTIVSGHATFSTAALSGGQHSITAVYGGGSGFASSTSTTLMQVVDQADSTTSLTSSPNPSTFGQSVTLVATVSSTSGTPTGTVTFLDGANQLGIGAINGSGQASLSTSALGAGPHTIYANYGGDVNFQSSSTSLPQSVSRAATTTAVVSSLDPSIYGQPVTFTATVSSTGGTPTGTVTFFSPLLTVIGSSVLVSGKATLTLNVLGAGPHSVYASYGGDTNFLSSISLALTQTINKATSTTSLNSSPNPSTFAQSVAFVASVQSQFGVPIGGGKATGQVTFMDGGQKVLGTSNLLNGVAELDLTVLGTGSHSISALYAGDANNNSSVSPSVVQVVNPPIATTTTVGSSLNPSYVGQAVSFTAAVSPSAATGTVTFYAGQVVLGSASLSGGQAILTTSSLPAGGLSIVASYSGDVHYASSASAKLTQTVMKASTTTSIAVSPNPSLSGFVTLSAHVQLGVPNGGIAPTGTVTFMIGSTVVGSAPVNINGIATLSHSFAPGKYNIKAVYGGSNACQGSVSPTVTLTAVL